MRYCEVSATVLVAVCKVVGNSYEVIAVSVCLQGFDTAYSLVWELFLNVCTKPAFVFYITPWKSVVKVSTCFWPERE